jgi:hypothetical protein
MAIFTKKSAATMRRRITFLRHAYAATCGIVRRRNQNAHIAGDKRGARAARVVRRGYIYKYIYGALRPQYINTYKKSSEKRKF